MHCGVTSGKGGEDMHWEGGTIGGDAGLTRALQPCGKSWAQQCYGEWKWQDPHLPSQSVARNCSKSVSPAGKLRPTLKGPGTVS